MCLIHLLLHFRFIVTVLHLIFPFIYVFIFNQTDTNEKSKSTNTKGHNADLDDCLVNSFHITIQHKNVELSLEQTFGPTLDMKWGLTKIVEFIFCQLWTESKGGEEVCVYIKKKCFKYEEKSHEERDYISKILSSCLSQLLHLLHSSFCT